MKPLSPNLRYYPRKKKVRIRRNTELREKLNIFAEITIQVYDEIRRDYVDRMASTCGRE
jgi:hypothetical protein